MLTLERWPQVEISADLVGGQQLNSSQATSAPGEDYRIDNKILIDNKNITKEHMDTPLRKNTEGEVICIP